MKFKGAQNPIYILNPTKVLFDDIDMGLNIVKRVSLAPELENSFQVASYLNEKGICVSIAHSNANFECVEEAVNNGFSHITHMYNGMSFINSPDYYCSCGVVEAGLYLDDLTSEIIADGKHQPIGLMKLLYKIKGEDKMLLTTDATSPTGMAGGNYTLGGLSILVTDGVAMLADRSSFAGSIATCDVLVRYAYKKCGIPLHSAVKMASLNHSKLIGMDNEIGSIKIGKKSDIIFFDDNINLCWDL
jgi:N-acetylglucosamine-6-phosphate deacetylase